MADEPRCQVEGGTDSDWRRRGIDIVVSASLAVLTLPLMVLAVIGSAIALRAWPLFSQDRIGRDGELFRFVKIRTLPTTVPAYADKFQLDLARIPAFCRILRMLHLDELPQLYLVLAGRMSLVGPRPEMRYLHERMPVRFAAQRTAVRPGCTGLWQISESCSGLISTAPEYDRFYLEHRTLRLDAWVLFRTALKMTGVARQLTLNDIPSWALRSGDAVVVDLRPASAETTYAERSALPAAAGR